MKKKEERIFIKKILDCADSFVYNNKQSKAEENRLKREELDLRARELAFQEKTKDRVDISLKEYENLKRELERYRYKCRVQEELLDKIQLTNYVNKIDPNSIRVETTKDLMRLKTRVIIAFDINSYDI